jgi:hypothetical protein
MPRRKQTKRTTVKDLRTILRLATGCRCGRSRNGCSSARLRLRLTRCGRARLRTARPPTLLAPMAAILGSDRAGRLAISAQTMRAFLDSLANRLDEARDISRYLTGLLVFLGLLGTFWGLIETVSSVGTIINNLNVGGDARHYHALRRSRCSRLT